MGRKSQKVLCQLTSQNKLTPEMLSRLGLRSTTRISLASIRLLTTKTTITDHATGKVITLADPEHPELADYQNPKPVLAQTKDPYAKYDFQQLRRNKNEPLNIDDDLYDMWSPDYYQFVSDKTALKHNAVFFSLVIGFGLSIYFFELNPEKPAMPRSFPYGGLAKELGSGSAETDYFYRVKPDEAAEAAGILPEDADIKNQRATYEQANADFIKV